MKNYNERLREYERQKLILSTTCKSSEEFNKKLRELIKKLKI